MRIYNLLSGERTLVGFMKLIFLLIGWFVCFFIITFILMKTCFESKERIFNIMVSLGLAIGTTLMLYGSLS